MIVYGEFNLDAVLQFRGQTRQYKVSGHSYTISLKSQRYFLFHKEKTCICGLEGKVFRLETHQVGIIPHFNLYSIENNKPVLMTKDHIIPRALGGTNTLDNYRTMCSKCNSLRGCDLLDDNALLSLRKLNLSGKALYNARKMLVENQNLLPMLDLRRRKLIKFEKDVNHWEIYLAEKTRLGQNTTNHYIGLKQRKAHLSNAWKDFNLLEQLIIEQIRGF